MPMVGLEMSTGLQMPDPTARDKVKLIYWSALKQMPREWMMGLGNDRAIIYLLVWWTELENFVTILLWYKDFDVN